MHLRICPPLAETLACCASQSGHRSSSAPQFSSSVTEAVTTPMLQLLLTDYNRLLVVCYSL